MPATTAKHREQINVVLTPGSPLTRRLNAAEEATGRSRTQIAREVLEHFLDIWLVAELRRRQVLETLRERAVAGLVTPANSSHTAVASSEREPPGDVLGYRRYLDAAGRFLDAPIGSADREIARAELATGLAAVEPDAAADISGELGGDAAAVLLKLRRAADEGVR